MFRVRCGYHRGTAGVVSKPVGGSQGNRSMLGVRGKEETGWMVGVCMVLKA